MGKVALQLERATLCYSPEEDRIRLLGLATNKDLLALWLTRRLVSNLLNHFKRLDIKGQLKSSPSPHLSSVREDIQLPVNMPAGGEFVTEFAVTELDITQIANMVRFVFRSHQDAQSVQLVLCLSDCETWLAALGRLCEEAGWMLSKSEFRETPTAESNPTTVTIH